MEAATRAFRSARGSAIAMFLCFASSTSSAALYPNSFASSLTLILLLFLSVSGRHRRFLRLGDCFGRRLCRLFRRAFARRLGGRRGRLGRRGFAAKLVNVDLPARELRGKPHVAPPLPDRLGKLVPKDVHSSPAGRLVENHLRDFRGL